LRTEQPDCGAILKDNRTVVHEVMCPVRGCKLGSFTGIHCVPPEKLYTRPMDWPPHFVPILGTLGQA